MAGNIDVCSRNRARFLTSVTGNKNSSFSWCLQGFHQTNHDYLKIPFVCSNANISMQNFHGLNSLIVSTDQFFPFISSNTIFNSSQNISKFLLYYQ